MSILLLYQTCLSLMMILQILFQFIWIVVFVSRDVSGSYGKQVYIRTKLPALGVLSNCAVKQSFLRLKL